jgi:hypothetical protein
MAEKHHPEIERMMDEMLDAEKVAAGGWLAALTGQPQASASPITKKHRCEIDLMIDEMIADGKSEQDILTAICKQYEPYDTIPQFGEGFVDYQARRLRNKDFDGVAGQAYDRGANAAMWLWQAQQRMKPAAK